MWLAALESIETLEALMDNIGYCATGLKRGVAF
jgi:hypothetical protein